MICDWNCRFAFWAMLTVSFGVAANSRAAVTWLNSFSANSTYDIAAGPNGEVYVADGAFDRIKKFDHLGNLLLTWGGTGSGAGQFDTPVGIAVNANGNVYVLESNSATTNRIQRFSADGQYIGQWSSGMNYPHSIAVAPTGEVYVTDKNNDRVKRFTATGGFLNQWGTTGAGNGQFDIPYGIAVNAAGEVYVVDKGNDRVQKFSAGGAYILQFSQAQFATYSPSGITLNGRGEVYVACASTSNLLTRFTSEGTYLESFPIGSTRATVNRTGSGEIYVTASGGIVKRYFDSSAWLAGTYLVATDAIVGPGQPLDTSFTVDSARALTVSGNVTVQPGGALTIAGGRLTSGNLTVQGTYQYISGDHTINGAVNVQSGGSVSLNGQTMTVSTLTLAGNGSLDRLDGHGTVNAAVSGGSNSAIEAVAGSLTLGDSMRLDGFRTDGYLTVGSYQVVLNSLGFAQLGALTTLSGGTLTVPNGVSLGVGRNLSGSGTVNGKVAAGFGSTIDATGNLTVGDSGAYDGFYSDGSLLTNANAVTINDRNTAVLGSLTQLGTASAQGTLTAGNARSADTYSHFLLEQGKNLVGRGYVNGHFKNHGDAVGDGTAMNQRVIFNSPWVVSGKGTFTNTLILGTFAPGDSPAISNGTNQAFGGTVQIELGGITPGSGDNNHDQINDSATIGLFGSPMLEIKPWRDYVPQPGDDFVIMTWQTAMDGTFGNVVVDPWFGDHGISFVLHYNNVGGSGNLTAEAVPEPSTLVLFCVGALALLAYVRQRRVASPRS